MKSLSQSTALLLSVLFAAVGCASEGTSMESLAFTSSGGKADGSCVDVVGFDVCGHSAEEVWNGMDVANESKFGDSPEIFIEGQVFRDGTFLGQHVFCNTLKGGFHCSFPVARGEEALDLYLAMPSHPDFVGEDENRTELLGTDWRPNGITRTTAARKVGVYSCWGVVDYVGQTDEIVRSDIYCSGNVN
ncbi:MAG: hypothetical protein KC417_02280 [Myxococcales bacterium]|nr:hypothetical protein [Myxococcales bacterium]